MAAEGTVALEDDLLHQYLEFLFHLRPILSITSRRIHELASNSQFTGHTVRQTDRDTHPTQRRRDCSPLCRGSHQFSLAMIFTPQFHSRLPPICFVLSVTNQTLARFRLWWTHFHVWSLTKEAEICISIVDFYIHPKFILCKVNSTLLLKRQGSRSWHLQSKEEEESTRQN